MEPVNLTWFYFHCVLALIIIVKDHNGTLEESLDNFATDHKKKVNTLEEIIKTR